MIKRVLIVEDEPSTQLFLKNLLLRLDSNLRIQCVATAEKAYSTLNQAQLDEVPIDVVISDLNLPGSDGLVLFEHSQKRQPGLEFLFISGSTYEEWFVRASKKSESLSFLRKPVSENALRQYWEGRFQAIGEFGG